MYNFLVLRLMNTYHGKNILVTYVLMSRSVGVISKLRHFLPQYTLVTLYNAIVMPHLMYCNIAWGHTFRTHVHKLQVLQKKVVRYITNSGYRSPSTPLFLQLHILPFDEMVSLNFKTLQYTFFG